MLFPKIYVLNPSQQFCSLSLAALNDKTHETPAFPPSDPTPAGIWDPNVLEWLTNKYRESTSSHDYFGLNVEPRYNGWNKSGSGEIKIFFY